MTGLVVALALTGPCFGPAGGLMARMPEVSVGMTKQQVEQAIGKPDGLSIMLGQFGASETVGYFKRGIVIHYEWDRVESVSDNPNPYNVQDKR